MIQLQRDIRIKVCIALIDKKMLENCLRWFGYVQCKSIVNVSVLKYV